MSWQEASVRICERCLEEGKMVVATTNTPDGWLCDRHAKERAYERKEE